MKEILFNPPKGDLFKVFSFHVVAPYSYSARTKIKATAHFFLTRPIAMNE